MRKPKPPSPFDRSRDLRDADIQRWLEDEHRARRSESEEELDPWELIKQGAFVAWLILGIIGALYVVACLKSHTWPLIGALPAPLFNLTSTPTPPITSPSP